MAAKKCYTKLYIRKLELSVNLGWRNPERKLKQGIELDLEISFPLPPKACVTDNLDDTLCYDELISTLREKIRTKKYRLVEHLCAEIYTLTKSHLPKKSKLNVKLTKYPKIQGLINGVCFAYGDEQ